MAKFVNRMFGDVVLRFPGWNLEGTAHGTVTVTVDLEQPTSAPEDQFVHITVDIRNEDGGLIEKLESRHSLDEFMNIKEKLFWIRLSPDGYRMFGEAQIEKAREDA